MLSVGLMILGSCKKNVVAPNSNSSGNPNPTQSNTQDSTTVGHFKMSSNKINKTSDGYQFNGTLSAKTNQDTLFAVGKGNFTVTVDPSGKITAIDGTGTPQFPDVGIFKDILQKFTWSAVKSHIEYQKGGYYIQKYNTNIPLNKNEYYLHFQVLNPKNGDHYELKSIGNSVVYNFIDLYIDINDPAVFFKLALFTPSGSETKSEEVAAEFWKKIKNTLASQGKTLGKYAGAPKLIIGISKQATFNTPTYTIGLRDSLSLKKIIGYDHIKSTKANLFLGVSGVPIPCTYVLQLDGQVYESFPGVLGNIHSAIDWLTQEHKYSKTMTYAGDINFGGKGIAYILDGVLPTINQVVGRDIFSNDIDLELADGFFQHTNVFTTGGTATTAPKTSSLQLGGGISTPLLSDLFGSNYQKYLPPIPQSAPQAYFYLNVPANLDSAFVVYEQKQLPMLFYGMGILNLSGYYKINVNGIRFKGVIAKIPPLPGSFGVTGSLNKNHFHFTGFRNLNISFGNVTLYAQNGKVTLDNTQGVSFKSSFKLPSGLLSEVWSGSITSKGMTLTGTMGSHISVGGHTFSISSSKVDAVTYSGITSKFNMDFYKFTAPMQGPILSNAYKFTGSHNFQVPINFAHQNSTLNGKINITVTPSGVNMTGTGTVTYTGLFNNTTTLYNGTLKINPNWNTKTIQVCAGNYCTKL